MENIFDRLQFVKGLNPNKESGVFDTREEAVNYVLGKHIVERPSLLAEPIILLYESEDEEKGPNVILAIGSVGKGTQSQSNRTFFIDTQKTEEEIQDLDERLEAAIRSLTIVPLESDTIQMHSEKTEDGTLLSGDVKIADYRIVDGIVDENIIETEGEKGIYAFVDMEYDPETFVITFRTNKVTKEFQLTPDQHVVRGWYSPKNESIFLELADGSKVEIDVVKLIDEWTVLPDSETPVLLYKEHVSSFTDSHEGVYDWQDVLTADVRVADHIGDNIIHKDRTGRYLYVKGTADNIKYSEGVTVKEAIDRIDTRVSTSEGNLIYKRPDGIYAYAMLDYKQAENKLIYTYSDGETEDFKTLEFQLNSVKVLEDITYDPVKEVIVIRYIDAKGEYQRVEIPVKDIIEEWDVNNEGHSIQLNKYRSEGQGKDILSADVKIHNGDNNILEDKDHTLYVNGIANNIKYDATGETTVKNVLDTLKSEDERIEEKLDDEIARSTAEDEKIEATIGTGFSTDAHETITYKFEQLTDKVNEEADKLQNEIDRSTSADTVHDGRLDTIETEIGEGFDPRNTVRDEIENLQSEIDAVSADSSSRLSDVINEDESIDVETRNDAAGKATIKVVKVNLSDEVEDEKPNIIKLNADGLYASADLSYVEEANKLIFKTTNSTKEIQLESMSSIISIEYNPTKEAIVITYMTNGHEIKVVEIPVGDLIREWKPSENTDGAIKMTLNEAPSGTTGKDILYAEVLLSSHEDNILVNDNGTLYVSDSGIAANASAIEALDGRMNTAESDIAVLKEGLREEVSARTLADEALGRRIDEEQNRAEAAELALSGKIDTDVLAEKNRAVSAETALQTAINNEITRATNEEARIEESLNDEITRSIAVDTDNTSRISHLETNLRDEIERAQTEEDNLSNAINNETTRARNVEQTLTTSINTEKNDRISGDTILNNAIVAESSTRLTEDTRIEGKLDAFTADTMSEIHEVHDLISAEAARSREADAVLEQKITTEESRAKGEETRIEGLINHEATRAIAEETRIEQKLDNEIARATREEGIISDALTAETAARISSDEALGHRIDDVTYTVDDTTSIDLTLNDKKISGQVKLEEGENIIKLGSGLYATVSLSYDSSANKIRLVTSNGEQEWVQLNSVGNLIDNIVYDPVEKAIIIYYHDGAGVQQTIKIPVGELFNDWDVDNSGERSGLVLTKTINTGAPDKLSGRVLISPIADNALTIETNGLYVSPTTMDEALRKANCATNELKVVEKQVFGQEVTEECGSGYTYSPFVGTNYITTATSLNHADYLLDTAIKSASSYTEAIENKVEEVSGNAECNRTEILTLETDYLGITIDHSQYPCGSGTRYQPSEGTKFISGATSFKQADAILDTAIKETVDRVTVNELNINHLSGHVNNLQTEVDAIEGGAGLNTDGTYSPSLDGRVISGATSLKNADELLNNALEDLRDDFDELMVASDTVTTHISAEQIGHNKHLKADVRLSHGNTELPGEGMTDEDLIIKDFSGNSLENGAYEFTDTNVLRVVDTTIWNPDYRKDAKWHGVYLSNAWNCGKYYDKATEATEIDKMVEEGYEVYNSNYRTDTASTASNYDYNNNARQE